MSKIDPKSTLIGALLATVAFLGLGAAQTAAAIRLGPVTVRGVPTPDQMVRVVEGSPLTVPADKVLVVTGVGSTANTPINNTLAIQILFDGQVVLGAQVKVTDANGVSGAGPAIPSVPPGLKAGAGQQVAVQDDGPFLGVLLGYLADA